MTPEDKLNKLIHYQNYSKKLFYQYKIIGSLIWLGVIVANLFTLKYVALHPEKLTHIFKSLWGFLDLAVLYIFKFYIDKRIDDYKKYYQSCKKEIKENHQLAYEVIKEKESLDNIIKDTNINKPKTRKI